jgi:uncharacterized protein (DUF302 family)
MLMFHYTVETEKSMETVVNDLEHSLKSRKFGILWKFDLAGTLQSKGFSHEQPYVILEVCNPAAAHQVIKENPLVGNFLPCKIAVYQHAGQTKIGMPKPTVLMELADDEGLVTFAKDIEDTLIAAIDEAK